MRSTMKVQEYLNSFINFELHLDQVPSRSFNLDRIRKLLQAVGDPQDNLKFVHVAGTKGKGSTCVFIAYILRAAGYRVGLYSSPHLYRINERIRVLNPGSQNILSDFNGSISDKELDLLVNKLKPQLEERRHDSQCGDLTYFEVLTAIALSYFVKKKTGIVVLETGLGGRLDATNAVKALVDVITPIGFDHMHLLGNTLDKIAVEKAAIIKDPESKVVIGKQHQIATKEILKRCKEFSIRPILIGKDVTYKRKNANLHGQSFDVEGRKGDYKNFKTSLLGEHQAQNAALAIAVIESLRESGMTIGKQAVKQGIRQTRWPGRFEIIQERPQVVVDCAHNIDSAEALVKTFKNVFPGKKAVLILGISKDKDVVGICRILEKIAKAIILTRTSHPRSYEFKDSDRKLFKTRAVTCCSSVKDALAAAYNGARKSDIILGTGSVFLAAQLRAEVKNVSV